MLGQTGLDLSFKRCQSLAEHLLLLHLDFEQLRTFVVLDEDFEEWKREVFDQVGVKCYRVQISKQVFFHEDFKQSDGAFVFEVATGEDKGLEIRGLGPVDLPQLFHVGYEPFVPYAVLAQVECLRFFICAID